VFDLMVMKTLLLFLLLSLFEINNGLTKGMAHILPLKLTPYKIKIYSSA